MKNSIVPLIPDSLWSVIFKDDGSWRVGLYKPKFSRQEDIDMLEKHTCPELFICLGGNMGIVIGSGAHESVTTMEPEQALMVTDYHNGFTIDPDGYFLVVERTDFSTEYIDRKTGKFLKKITLGKS